jgi:hypothetical protein
MRPRAILEVIVIVSVTGLFLEVAKIHLWALTAAGVVAAVWLLARSH